MSATVSCPSCGKPVDTLRAGHVAILDGSFRYFCDEACKLSYVLRPPAPWPSQVETAEPPRVAMRSAATAMEASVITPAPAPVVERRPPEPAGDGFPVHQADRESSRTVGSTTDSPSPSEPPASEPSVRPLPLSTGRTPRFGALIAAARAYGPLGVALLGIVAGALAPSLALLGPSAQSARFILATVAVMACGVRAVVVAYDPSDVHPVASVLSVVAVWGTAFYAKDIGDERALRLASVAGLAAGVHLVSALLVDRAREGVRLARYWIRQRLDVQVRVVRGDQTVVVPSADVKPGETIVAVAGDTLGVDARITAGEAVVTPWIDASVELKKAEGDPLVAGARVVSGSVRAVTTWSGSDRAWLKLIARPSLRPDVVGPLPRRVRVTLERGAIVAAVLVAGLGMANGARGLDVLAMAAVAAFCLAGSGAVGVVALHQARGPISALAHGVVYRDAAAFDTAGRTDVAVLCSRSTLLMGSPEIVVLETLGSLTEGRLLALAAGASSASSHPSSIAIRDAAGNGGSGGTREPPESVRHASYHPGLGVTALAANGERLVVGSRALLLREKVSIALADTRVTQLEGEGRSVTLVALAGKLVGLLALQDGLRPGARAAVQRLLDAGIEPVLLSGEARETCETIGRALDVEHIRPEVLPQDRGTEVRALADGGHVVAVLGYPASDDTALGAAEVSVALGAAGGTPGEWGISLASDDVRDAARALSIAIECRDRTRVAIALGFVPGALSAIGIALGIVPLAAGPIMALAGLVAAVVHARK